MRCSGERTLIAALNFTPVPRGGYRIGVPRPGYYREVLNTDAVAYGGTNTGNLGGVHTEERPWMGHPYSLCITLPPLAAVALMPEEAS
jgi:1,4-alpha-glucan branching enzyme